MDPRIRGDDDIMEFPKPDAYFPKNSSSFILLFWIKYWIYFFLFLPIMLVRQIFVSGKNFFAALFTWNREFDFFGGELKVIYLNNWKSLLATTLFGERFLFILYQDLIVDPGPPFSGAKIKKRLADAVPKKVAGVAVTHFHEEHIGNAPLVAEILKIPIYGSKRTLAEIRRPERLSYARMAFMGQPHPGEYSPPLLREVQERLDTAEHSYLAVHSPGHCEGHISYYDPGRKILFSGDSFLHEVFTSPNEDVDSLKWMETLQRYEALEIRTMIGSHGYLSTEDPAIPNSPFVVERKSPGEMIEHKLKFIRWARQVVFEGEKRNLPYSVIEACLLPWQRGWSWKNWFNDESFRLFSAGEFSRTHFVRSLSENPEKVPARFARMSRWADRFRDRESK